LGPSVLKVEASNGRQVKPKKKPASLKIQGIFKVAHSTQAGLNKYSIMEIKPIVCNIRKRSGAMKPSFLVYTDLLVSPVCSKALNHRIKNGRKTTIKSDL
jgi:hypothetical protein